MSGSPLPGVTAFVSWYCSDEKTRIRTLPGDPDGSGGGNNDKNSNGSDTADGYDPTVPIVQVFRCGHLLVKLAGWQDPEMLAGDSSGSGDQVQPQVRYIRGLPNLGRDCLPCLWETRCGRAGLDRRWPEPDPHDPGIPKSQPFRLQRRRSSVFRIENPPLKLARYDCGCAREMRDSGRIDNGRLDYIVRGRCVACRDKAAPVSLYERRWKARQAAAGSSGVPQFPAPLVVAVLGREEKFNLEVGELPRKRMESGCHGDYLEVICLDNSGANDASGSNRPCEVCGDSGGWHSPNDNCPGTLARDMRFTVD